MKYKSCHLIEHGISIDVDSIKACCLSREFDKGQLMVEPKYEKGRIDWKHLFEVKRNHRNYQKEQGDLPACEGCYNLREEDWDDEDYISYINFDHWSQCNSNCIYCGVRRIKPKTKNNVLNAVKELIKQGKFRNFGEITFQGGEPTVLREFEPLLKLFIKQGSKLRVHSSGILYSKAVKEGLKNGMVTVVISPDSVYPETYKTIKRVDKSKNVWENIKKYRKDLKGEFVKSVKVKYIIIPGVNDNLDEIDDFFKKLKEVDIKSVIVDVEYTYANVNKNDISPHVYLLMDYFEHLAEINGMEYDLYDSAKYIKQNRNYPKTNDYSHGCFVNKFTSSQWENINKNIEYK